jgi:predicted Mrr-cat superfamily restriction endonuclease
MNEDHVSRPVWVVRAGKVGQDEEAALTRGMAIIGFDQVEDLTQASSTSDTVSAVRRAYPEAVPTTGEPTGTPALGLP